MSEHSIVFAKNIAKKKDVFERSGIKFQSFLRQTSRYEKGKKDSTLADSFGTIRIGRL
jgi:hypothetical protein